MNLPIYFKKYGRYPSKCYWYNENDVFRHLCLIFAEANKKLIKDDYDLFVNDASETTVCAALMHCLKTKLYMTPFNKYKVDIEYNRNFDRIKQIYSHDGLRTINCDLIVHSRGHSIWQDNLISIEMKKEYRHEDEKQLDRERLRALTRASYNNAWIFDGTELPKYVCRYILGIYYEIKQKDMLIEYYQKGNLIKTYSFPWRKQ